MLKITQTCTFDGCCQLLIAVVQRARLDADREWLSAFLDGTPGADSLVATVGPKRQTEQDYKLDYRRRKAKQKRAVRSC